MSQIATHESIEVQGLKTHFVRIGTGTKPVLFLHGWGGSTDSFFRLGQSLIQKRPDLQLILVDYPGFGLTECAENQAWDTYHYAEWVYDFMTTLNLQKADFYVHSFGARILIRLQEKHPNVINKMVLTGAAGIKWPLTPRQKISMWLSKVMPKFERGFLAKIQKLVVVKVFGARDWGNVNPKLKTTLKAVLEEADFRDQLSAIKSQTLIIWGAKDGITPLKSGNVYAKELPNSQIKILPEGRHGIHHTHPDQIIRALVEFL